MQYCCRYQSDAIKCSQYAHYRYGSNGDSKGMEHCYIWESILDPEHFQSADDLYQRYRFGHLSDFETDGRKQVA